MISGKKCRHLNREDVDIGERVRGGGLVLPYHWLIFATQTPDNCIGPCDNFISVGQSAIWNNRGELLVQMDSESEGMVMINTISDQADIYALASV